MAGQSIPLQKEQMWHQAATNTDAKKNVNDILKRADQWIRKGDLIRAQAEIHSAKEIDPRNEYIFALEERIASLKATPAGADLTPKNSDSRAPAGNGRPAEPLQARPGSLSSGKESSLSAASKAALPIPGHLLQPQACETLPNRSIEQDSYRNALLEAWSDGILTERENRYLLDLRTALDLPEDVCINMEKHVKYECYQAALLRLLSDPSTDDTHMATLTELQNRFRITDEEHLQILTELMNTLHHKRRDSILVIDDDTRLLELLEESLKDNGFDVTAVSTSDEAYALLRTCTPDLILCDISLATSTMCGFTFYEKIQELQLVQRIPFIFLTGIADESLVCTSKELGIDDYLLKPISEEMLVSTLRGKLRRFRQLNNILPPSLPTMEAA